MTNQLILDTIISPNASLPFNFSSLNLLHEPHLHYTVNILQALPLSPIPFLSLMIWSYCITLKTFFQNFHPMYRLLLAWGTRCPLRNSVTSEWLFHVWEEWYVFTFEDGCLHSINQSLGHNCCSDSYIPRNLWLCNSPKIHMWSI